MIKRSIQADYVEECENTKSKYDERKYNMKANKFLAY